MNKSLFTHYKVALLLSITLFIVFIALRVERDAINFAFLFAGSILGAFALDLDYFIYAYFFEPEKDVSRQIRAYTKHHDITGALKYALNKKNEITDKTLNNVVFQVVLLGLTVFVVASSTNLFVKALLISVAVNSMYRMMEEYVENGTKNWFWALKNKPDSSSFYTYTAIISLVMLYCFIIF